MNRMTEKRFTILETLHKGPATIRELAKIVDVEEPAITAALRELKDEVEQSNQPKINPGTGRAAKTFTLTRKAKKHYPDYVKAIERVRTNRAKKAETAERKNGSS